MNTRGTWWLVGTAVLLLVFIVFVERRQSVKDQPQGPQVLFAGLVPSQVTRIDVVSGQDVLRVEKLGLNWRLTQPVVYPAQGRAIDLFLDACTKLATRTGIPAEDIASQPRGLADYGLQPPVGTVTIQQGGKTFELRLGAKAPLGESVYAQVSGDAGVKLIESAMLDSFPRTPAEWRDRALLNLTDVQFNRLEVRTGGRGFEVALDPASRQWVMSKPPPVKRADNYKISLLLREIVQWPVQAFISDDPAIGLEQFGLQPPTAELVFGLGTNDLVTVQFGGSPTNAPDFVFARRLSHTNIVLVPSNWLRVLTQPFTEFRDTRLLTFAPTNATQIDVGGLVSFSVQQQTNGAWRVNGPVSFTADKELVEGFLLQLHDLNIAEFEKDVVTETDLAGFGLLSPRLQIKVFGPATHALPGVTNSLLAHLLIGTNRPPSAPDRPPTAVYARRSDEAAVYVLPLGEASKLPLNPLFLRDRQLWSFGTSNVVSITASLGTESRKILHDGKGGWKAAPGSSEGFESAAVDEMVHRLGQFRAVAWTAFGDVGLNRFGIDTGASARIELEIRTADGVISHKIYFGRTASAGHGPYASTTLDGQTAVFEFPAGLFGDLIHFVFPKP